MLCKTRWNLRWGNDDFGSNFPCFGTKTGIVTTFLNCFFCMVFAWRSLKLTSFEQKQHLKFVQRIKENKKGSHVFSPRDPSSLTEQGSSSSSTSNCTIDISSSCSSSSSFSASLSSLLLLILFILYQRQLILFVCC